MTRVLDESVRNALTCISISNGGLLEERVKLEKFAVSRAAFQIGDILSGLVELLEAKDVIRN